MRFKRIDLSISNNNYSKMLSKFKFIKNSSLYNSNLKSKDILLIDKDITIFIKQHLFSYFSILIKKSFVLRENNPIDEFSTTSDNSYLSDPEFIKERNNIREELEKEHSKISEHLEKNFENIIQINFQELII
jgi:hypothetical protein